MPAFNKHIIQKQTIEIEFKNPEDSFGLPNRISEVFYENLQPQMEILLDEMFGENQFASVEKLEIDCGLLNKKNWEHEFAGQVIRKLKEGLLQVNKKEHPGSEMSETSAAGTFFFFLENGFMPWNKRINTISDLEQLINVDDEIINRLKKLILQKPNVSKRLVSQFSDEFVSKLLAAYTQNIKQETDTLSVLIEKISVPESVKHGQDRIVKSLLNEAVLRVFASASYKNRELEFFTFLLTKVENNDDLKSEINEILRKLHVKSEKQSPEKKPGKAETGTSAPSGARELKDSTSAAPGTREPGNNTLAGPGALEPKDSISAAPGARKNSNENASPVDTIYITNAGLVLLHPFLPVLFDTLKLTEQNAWNGQDSVYQAIQATQFLVSGKDETEEFELMLNKILCGTDMGEVVPTTTILNEEIKTECDNLLKAAISNWKVLKNTSADGLREAFLQRNGKLSRAYDGWHLQVEQKTIDTLMNHLPWGIGIIKLPWMNEMLYVDWV